MPIAVRHGKPGSYKTSTGISDTLVPKILEGSPVVTNVRGLNVDKVFEVYGEGVERDSNQYILILDFDDREKREDYVILLRYFFLWCPKGAFLMVDEAQLIFPMPSIDKTFRMDSVLKQNFPSRLVPIVKPHIEAFLEEGQTFESEWKSRPNSIAEAFDMHRHYNWDMLFTMPDIKHFHTYVRGVCEFAWLHRNQASVGVKGFFLEVAHRAENNGVSVSDVLARRNRKADKDVFECYKSTVTGVAGDTQYGSNPFLSFKFLAVVAILLLAITKFIYDVVFNNSLSFIFGDGEVEEVVDEPSQDSVQVVSSVSSDFPRVAGGVDPVLPSEQGTGLVASQALANFQREQTDLEAYHFMKSPYGDIVTWYISGVLRHSLGYSDYIFQLVALDDTVLTPSYHTLQSLGYSVYMLGDCRFDLRFKGNHYKYIGCPPSPDSLQVRESDDRRRTKDGDKENRDSTGFPFWSSASH